MPLGQQHVVHAFHLGQHEVAQAVAGLADDDVQVLREAGVVHGMHACSHAGAGRGIARQRGHQARMGRLLAHGGAVLAVQRDIEHAGAELIHHLGLQLQALAHARFHAAVVIADGQVQGTALRIEQHLGRVCARGSGRGGSHGLRWATMNRRGKASRRRPSARTP